MASTLVIASTSNLLAMASTPIAISNDLQPTSDGLQSAISYNSNGLQLVSPGFGGQNAQPPRNSREGPHFTSVDTRGGQRSS